MKRGVGRREFLKTSAAVAAISAGAFRCMGVAHAAPIEVPMVDRLAIRVLVDSSFDLFFRPAEVSGARIAPPPRAPDFRRTLHDEWGLSLWLESGRADEQRIVMLDFGYSPSVRTAVVAEIAKLEPDVLVPMHCSGLNFLAEARAQIPDKVVATTTGSRIAFGT